MANNTNNRHPTTAALIDYLDNSCSGDCSDEDKLHIQQCVFCLNEVVQISESRSRLQQLPQVQAPAHLWENIKQEIPLPPSIVQKNNWQYQWLATAASIVLVVTLFIFNPLQNVDQQPNIQQLPAPADNTEYLSLIQESQQLESALAYMDRQPAIINLSMVGRISQYRDSIATIDVALIEHSQSGGNHEFRNTLMKERIHLMQQLVKQKAKPLMDKYQTF